MGRLAGTMLLILLSSSATAREPVRTAPITVRLPWSEDWIQAVALSPDGRTLAAGTLLNRIVTWDLPSGKLLSSLQPQDCQRARCLVFAPDGKYLASVHDTGLLASKRARIHVWKIAEGRQLRAVHSFRTQGFGTYDGPWQAAFAPDGKSLVAADISGAIRQWNLQTGEPEVQYYGGVAASFTADGKVLVSVCNLGTVHRWMPGTNRLIAPSRAEGAQDYLFVENAVFTPGGRMVAIGDGHTTWLKDSATGQTLRRLERPYATAPLAFSRDGRVLAMRARAGISLISTETAKDGPWFEGYIACAFSPVSSRWARADVKSIIVDDIPRLWPGPQRLADKKQFFPLRAEVVVHRSSYVLDFGGLKPEEFSEGVRDGLFAPTPVDITVRLKSTCDRPLTIDVGPASGGSPTFWLAGPGAVNIPLGLDQVVGPPRKPLVLAPGKTHEWRVHRLDGGGTSYWLLPGEYTLHAAVEGFLGNNRMVEGGTGQFFVAPCPPAKLHVLPARTPGEFLDRPRHHQTLGSLVVPEDPATTRLWDKLRRPVSFDAEYAGRHVGRILEFLAEKYGLDLLIDEAAFRKAGRSGIASKKPSLGHLEDLQLGAVISLVLEPVDARCVVRGKTVWIVPGTPSLSLGDRLPLARAAFRCRLNRPITFAPGFSKGTTLGAALNELGRRFGFTPAFDHQAFARAGITNADARPVELPPQVDVPLRQILRKLLAPAGARYLSREGIVVVVPRTGTKKSSSGNRPKQG